MSRAKRDPTAWRASEQGLELYRALRAEAQRKANETGFDYGIEPNDLFHTWRMFLLPKKQYRTGHELRCEVISPENLSTTQAGHGP